MNLFFSYGHDDNQEVVLQLCRDLRKEGHEVWIDLNKIHDSTDWRYRISNGIEQSEAVISFFSNHAFRDFGVCLDELMIAVGLRGSLIQGVRLEDLKQQKIRESISHHALIDMRDWRQMKEKGQYEQWYQSKLNEILEFVNDPYIQKYSDEIERIRSWIQPGMKDITQKLLEGKYYSPRSWIRPKIDEAIEKGGRIILLQGAPGTGKSMFVTHEFISFEPARVVLFCKYSDRSNITLQSLISEMVFMLAAKEDDYREELLKIIPEDGNRDWFKNRNASELFTDLIIRPLNRVADQCDHKHAAIYILIDGLDEMIADEDEGQLFNPMARLLKEKAVHLPDFVKFILTSRPDTAVLSELESVSSPINMDDHPLQNQQDVLNYFLNRRNSSRDTESRLKKLTDADLQNLAEKSCGNFLYASVAMDAFEKGLFEQKDIETLSPDLALFYLFIFNKLFPTRDEYDCYQQILAALAFAQSVVPLKTIQRIAGTNEAEQKKRLDVISILVKETEEGIGLFHKSLFDWLTSPKAFAYRITEKQGQLALAQSLLMAYRQGAEQMNIFELRYLLPYVNAVLTGEAQPILKDVLLAKRMLDEGQKLESGKQIQAALDLAQSAMEIYETVQDLSLSYRCGRLAVDLLHQLARVEQTGQYAWRTMEYGEKLLESIQSGQDLNKTEEILLNRQQGDLCLLAAYSLYRQDKDEQADQWYQKAETYFSKADAPERVMVVLRRRMEMYNLSRDSRKMEELFNNAMQDVRLKELQNRNLTAYCEYLRFLGVGSRSLQRPELERYQMSLQYLDQEWKICLSYPDLIGPAEKGHCCYERAVSLYKFNDRLEEALEACQSALEYIEESEWSTSVGVCDTLGQLGNTALKLFNEKEKNPLYLQQSRAAFERAYKIRKSAYTDYNRYTTISLGNLVLVQTKLNTPESLRVARQYMNTVLEVREQLFSTSNLFWRAMGYRTNAQLLEQEGDLQEAKSYLEKAADLFETIGRAGERGVCLKELGRLSEDHSLKRQYLEEALDLITKSYHPAHTNTLEITRLVKELNRKTDEI